MTENFDERKALISVRSRFTTCQFAKKSRSCNSRKEVAGRIFLLVVGIVAVRLASVDRELTSERDREESWW